ncbi:hypothetical protein HDV00_010713 [Rhizophlyctis rosea]|nr:hypothetical protein HDV00_010713 [Rhizophlyctis rosea]
MGGGFTFKRTPQTRTSPVQCPWTPPRHANPGLPVVPNQKSVSVDQAPHTAHLVAVSAWTRPIGVKPRVRDLLSSRELGTGQGHPIGKDRSVVADVPQPVSAAGLTSIGRRSLDIELG